MLAKLSLKTVAKISQRVQRECTGYYCGYTFKGQAIGRKYLLKASQSLDYLTETLEKKTPAQRMHHITNKCFSDMFHRCCSRPTAEEWNLATFWHPQDVTNAEFQRTWRSVAFPGAQLLAKLEYEMSTVKSATVTKVLPRPSASEAESEDVIIKHYPDLYGYRGPRDSHKDVFYLNAWEFLMLWEVKILPKPASAQATIKKTPPQQGKGDLCLRPPALTEWNDKKQQDESKGFKLNPEAVKFYGRNNDILFYTKEAGGSEKLRNTFYMQRRRRPMVPAPASCPMPDKQRSGERRDRLYLVYLQPWVLDPSWALPGIVPHISCLNKVEDPSSTEDASVYSYSEAWKKFISQNIPSRHQHRIIVQFMAACCGKSKTTDPQTEVAAASNTRDCPPSDLLLSQVHALLDALGAYTPRPRKTKAMGQGDKTDGEDEGSDNDQKQLSLQMSNALKTVNDLWQRDSTAWTAARENMANSKLDVSQMKKSTCQRRRPQSGKESKSEQCAAYIRLTKTNVTTWWRKIRSSKTPPTEEQTKYLEYVIERCQTERDELQKWHAPKGTPGSKLLTEPSRCALLGIPGAGKSLCLTLLRDFFENVLGWRHGVQFQFLAAQNSMAALIGGATVHAWGVIPTNKVQQQAKHANKDVDWHQLFENCISMRWLVLDEMSCLSLGLLGTLETFLRTKACTRHPYAFQGAIRRRQPRMFGGLNLCTAGDLWQLGPVRDNPVFSHPMRKTDGTRYEAGEQRMIAMF